MLLRTLMKTVSSSWRWTKERYPQIDLSDRSRRRHVVFHLTKALGALAGEEEHVDHGLAMDRGAERTAIAKLLLGTLQLAEVEGMSEEDLVREIQELLKANG